MGGPTIKYREIVRRLERLGFALGFAFDRQTARSHEIWFNEQSGPCTTIPNHPGGMPEVTLRPILYQGGITPADFLDRL